MYYGEYMFRNILVFLLLLSVFIGCGTAHHFVPHRPLENGEWQVSTYLHVDIGQPSLKFGFGEVSAWYGQSNNVNLGFGLNSPLGISHLSFAKYWNTKGPDYLSMSGHINQITGLNNNPYLELMLGYSFDHGKVRQTLSAGVAYGHGNNILGGAVGLQEGNGKRPGGAKNRLMRVFKYQIASNDIAFSFAHYHGHHYGTSSDLAQAIINDNDTILFLPADHIDSIVAFDNSIWTEYNAPLGLFLPDGDTIIIHNGYERSDLGVGAILFVAIVNFIWDDYEKMLESYGYSSQYITREMKIPPNKPDTKVYVNRNEMLEHYRLTGEILITELPIGLLDKLPTNFSCKQDNSFGLSIQADGWDHQKDFWRSLTGKD